MRCGTISVSLAVPPSKVFGVATFYHYFRLQPPGQHACVVCTGTACYINGSMEILAAIRARFGVGPDETTEDGKLSIRIGRCFGSCGLAPAAIVDDEVDGRVRPTDLVERLEAL